MAYNFLGRDREQLLLVRESVRDWLPEDHLVFTVLDVVGEFDLSDFYSAYRSDGSGGGAYHPAVMIALILYAYSVGRQGAREIERCCENDVAFRIIMANEIPDHSTIARFMIRHQEMLQDLFCQLLELLASAGMLSSEVLSVDGTKLIADVSENGLVDYDDLAEALIREGIELNARQDAEFGVDIRGDEARRLLRDSKWRNKTLKEIRSTKTAIGQDDPDQLEVSKELADNSDSLEIQDSLVEVDVSPDVSGDVEAETMPVQENSRENQDNFRGIDPNTSKKKQRRKKRRSKKVNVVDTDCKFMKTRRGLRQGYNAQAVVTEEQVVVAGQVTTDTDTGWFKPMADQAFKNLQVLDIEMPKVMVADAGYWNPELFDNNDIPFDVYCAVQRHQQKHVGIDNLDPDLLLNVIKDFVEKRISRKDAGALLGVSVGQVSQFAKRYRVSPKKLLGIYSMREKMSSEEAKEHLKTRKCSVEPVFGQIKTTQNMGRVKRRSLEKIDTEWKLSVTAHNLKKYHKKRKESRLGNSSFSRGNQKHKNFHALSLIYCRKRFDSCDTL